METVMGEVMTNTGDVARLDPSIRVAPDATGGDFWRWG